MASSDRVLASRSRLDSQPISKGALFVNRRLKFSTLCVICAYAPTSPEEQKDAFFIELQSVIDIVAAKYTLLLAGRFNAQVGTEDPQQWHGCPGKLALKRNTLGTSSMAMRLLDCLCGQ